LDKKILNKQAQHWENTFSKKIEMFGVSPSDAAIKALKSFKEEGLNKILEIGAGQGRDTFYFAKNGLKVQVLDYSQTAIDNIKKKIKILGYSKLITAKKYDVRKPLEFSNENFDGSYTHMLYCMAFTTNELFSLNSEIFRVLKRGGLNIYTVRNTTDGDYKNGIYRGEDLYESDGFVVHFFSEDKIRKLSEGFDILSIESFEEGSFPRKLFKVILKKKLFIR
jgi:SAM-dependent methyltransferase